MHTCIYIYIHKHVIHIYIYIYKKDNKDTKLETTEKETWVGQVALEAVGQVENWQAKNMCKYSCQNRKTKDKQKTINRRKKN